MRMKNLKKRELTLILFLILLINLTITVSAQDMISENNFQQDKITIYFFWGEGCPHCEIQKPYLEEWGEKYKNKLEIKSYETWKDSSNVHLFQEVAKAHGIQARGVPTTFIGEKHWIGFSLSMASEMEQYIQSCINAGCKNLAKDINFSKEFPKKNKISELCIHIFLDGNCIQCQNIENYLKEIDKRYNFEIEKYNVNEDGNKQIFQQFKENYGLKVDLYPTLFIGNQYLMGEEPIKKALEGEIEKCLKEGCPCPLSKIRPFTSITAKPDDVTADTKQTINLFGKEIDVGKMPLVFSTFVISFIDGFNPCSLWVITFLLGIVILTGSRKKILTIGFTYLIVAGLVYGLFILGMISVFSYIGYLVWIRILVASIAIIFALVNIKDFFWYKKGLSFTIPDSYKPKIFKKVRNLMRPENKLRTLIIGSAIMALGITLVELPCTAGFPMLWSNIVASHNVGLSFFMVLFSIYLLTYFLIELVIFLSVVFTLRASRFEEKHGRLLKLIGGIIMFALAMVLLFNPDTLNDIGATVLLFAGAIIISLLIAWVYNKKSLGNKKTSLDLEEKKDSLKEIKENKTLNRKKEESEKKPIEENIKKEENIKDLIEENKND